MAPQDAIDEAWQTGRAAWPGIKVDPATFADWARERNIAPEWLIGRSADLYLVAGCLAGNVDALTAFDAQFLAPLKHGVGRILLSSDQADELRQQLRCTFLVPPNAKIGQFRGEAPLRAWVHVCAARKALALVANLNAPSENGVLALDQLVAPQSNQEVGVIKSQYRDAFQAALETCFNNLSARNKTLLRMHFLDGMTIDAMGLVFNVHRATAARWLVSIRRQVLKEICAKVSWDLRTSSSEVTQLVHLLRSEVRLSVERILGKGEETP